MIKLLFKTKKYHVARWLFPVAMVMIFLTGVTYRSAEASQNTALVIEYNQKVEYANINPTDLITLTNRERADKGLSMLKTNKLLTNAALEKAKDMKENQYFDHYRLTDGKTPWDFIEEAGYDWAVAGENLARGYKNNGQVVEAWMESSTHRKNLLNPRYEEVGVAIITSSKNGLSVTLTVQMFGTPK